MTKEPGQKIGPP